MKYLSILAVIGSITLSFNSKIHQPSFRTYHFIQGKVLREAKTASSYELWITSFSECHGRQNLPCLITFNTEIYPTLQDYLDSFDTVDEVRLAAVQTRSF